MTELATTIQPEPEALERAAQSMCNSNTHSAAECPALPVYRRIAARALIASGYVTELAAAEGKLQHLRAHCDSNVTGTMSVSVVERVLRGEHGRG